MPFICILSDFHVFIRCQNYKKTAIFKNKKNKIIPIFVIYNICCILAMIYTHKIVMIFDGLHKLTLTDTELFLNACTQLKKTVRACHTDLTYTLRRQKNNMPNAII